MDSLHFLKKVIILFIAFGGLFLFCSKEKENENNETNVKVVSSFERGTIDVPSGYSISVIPGSVPANNKGESGSISFSIEVGIEPPMPLPSDVKKISDFIFCGPDGFQFAWPLRVVFPAKNEESSEGLYIYQYDPLEEEWKVYLPSYIDSTEKKIGADVLNLGYFVLVKRNEMLAKLSSETSDGGVKFTGENGFYYTLTIQSYNLKYQNFGSYNLTGYTFSSGDLGPLGPPNPCVTGFLPQGTYTFLISKTKPGTLSELPKIYTYTRAATVVVNKPLEFWGWGRIKDHSWTILELPSGGDWKEGRPDQWGASTITYGTGAFQATLTWVNSSASVTDLDLHLTRIVGNNEDMHVYWSDQIAQDSSFELDRDWTSEYGNAVENIYSLKDPLPKGKYTLKVVHFDGDYPKNFNVRVIRSNSVKNYRKTITKEGQEIEIMNFTIE